MLGAGPRDQDAVGSNQGACDAQEISRRLALSALASAALMVPIVAQVAPADEIANA
jgi:hypothetical protein